MHLDHEAGSASSPRPAASPRSSSRRPAAPAARWLPPAPPHMCPCRRCSRIPNQPAHDHDPKHPPPTHTPTHHPPTLTPTRAQASCELKLSCVRVMRRACVRAATATPQLHPATKRSLRPRLTSFYITDISPWLTRPYSPISSPPPNVSLLYYPMANSPPPHRPRSTRLRILPDADFGTASMHSIAAGLKEE
jgi:hypothetical protein